MSTPAPKKESRRVRYTKMALRESLLSLLTENPIRKITVSKVCEQADVNRSTFYLYYKDVYDLLEKIEDDLYQQILSALEKAPEIMPTCDNLKRLYEIIYKNRDLCRVISGEYGDKNFLQKIVNIQKDRMIAEWRKRFQKCDDSTLEYLHAFSTSANLGLLEYWIVRDYQETPEQLAKLGTRILMEGINSFATSC